ncbi:hypothetical protein [Nostoc spongiaeforme]|nr:hypothetical protein [Nostoc spongiaeforme]
MGTRDRRGEKLAVKSVVTHILHLAPTNGIRGYKNEVRLRGLM